MNDLRNPPYSKDPADHSAYGDQPKTKESDGLPIGTQQRFLDAEHAAKVLGSPLNTLLSIRATVLLSASGGLSPEHLAICCLIHRFVDRLKRWMRRSSLPSFYIWVREASAPHGDHLHLGFHAPAELRSSLAAFVAKQLREPVCAGGRPLNVRTEGEFACGENGSWHLAGDTRPNQGVQFLAAYLGKGEPSSREFRGTRKPNRRKPIRGKAHGGRTPSEKYDLDQGMISGTATRRERFYISKALQQAVRDTFRRNG
jgi:hypothetical protein